MEMGAVADWTKGRGGQEVNMYPRRVSCNPFRFPATHEVSGTWVPSVSSVKTNHITLDKTPG